MERKTWKFGVSFGPGPWEEEPDKIQWKDEYTGLPCLIVRNQMGALCGYVGVPYMHPYHGEVYCAHEMELECHGGLTFSGACQVGGKICHEVDPGEDDNTWWFGFDCAHCGDVVPIYDKIGLPQIPNLSDKVAKYRDVEYVTEQVTSLARQLGEKMVTT